MTDGRRTSVPWLLIAGSVLFAVLLFYVLFSKFVPIISMWELKVGEQPELTEPQETPDEAATLWRTHP